MEQPIIGFSAWELIVACGNLLVLYAILRVLLFKKVKVVIDSREGEVENMYKQAENVKAEAFALKAEYEKNISGAKDKALEIINDATASANKKAEQILNDAQDEVVALKNKADLSISLERKRAMSEMTSEVAGLVTLAASKVIEKEIDENTHKNLINDFINQVGE